MTVSRAATTLDHDAEDTAGRRADAAAPRAGQPLRILFALPSIGSLRYFQSALEALADRGHELRLLLESGGHRGVHSAWLAQMSERPNFHCDTYGRWRNRWH